MGLSALGSSRGIALAEGAVRLVNVTVTSRQDRLSR